MIKAALFDLDGVVFDTEPQYTLFWGEIGRQYHSDIPDFAKRIKGQTLTQIFSAYFSHLQSEQSQIVSRLNEFERNMHFDYVPGFQQFVLALKEKNIKTAIVTSSNNEKMRSIYAAHPEFRDYFDAILTSEDFSHSKPHPECYLKGAEVLGVLPDECIGFEDSFNGLKAARAANLYVEGLANTNSASAISDYCDLVINDFSNWTHRIPPFI